MHDDQNDPRPPVTRPVLDAAAIRRMADAVLEDLEPAPSIEAALRQGPDAAGAGQDMSGDGDAPESEAG